MHVVQRVRVGDGGMYVVLVSLGTGEEIFSSHLWLGDPARHHRHGEDPPPRDEWKRPVYVILDEVRG